jgi:hypothetical protein
MNTEVYWKYNLVTIGDITVTSLTTFHPSHRCSIRCIIDLWWIGKDFEGIDRDSIEILSQENTKNLDHDGPCSGQDSILAPLEYQSIERYRHAVSLSMSIVSDIHFVLFLSLYELTFLKQVWLLFHVPCLCFYSSQCMFQLASMVSCKNGEIRGRRNWGIRENKL